MIKPLTSLRFVFAFLVFMSHMNLFPHEEPGFLWHLFYEGYAGVSFFFMLSGFILAYTYQQRLIDGTATVRSFYVARIARIYPLHLLALFVALFFLQFFNHPSPADFFHLGINTFLLQSFIPGQEFLFNSVSWSLSDEAFFYALFPLIVFSTFRDRRRGTILFWSVLGCVIVVSAYLLRNPHGPTGCSTSIRFSASSISCWALRSITFASDGPLALTSVTRNSNGWPCSFSWRHTG